MSDAKAIRDELRKLAESIRSRGRRCARDAENAVWDCPRGRRAKTALATMSLDAGRAADLLEDLGDSILAYANKKDD